MKYTIYCDLDGVLVNFDKGYEDLTGINISSTFLNGSVFWAPIEKEGASFWSNLEWMEDGKDLWNYIKKHTPYILSAPSKSISSKIGKDHWCKININKQYKSLLLFPRAMKQKFANENSILIDDLKETIDEWNKKGGIGIHHVSSINTIKQLKKLGL